MFVSKLKFEICSYCKKTIPRKLVNKLLENAKINVAHEILINRQ